MKRYETRRNGVQALGNTVHTSKGGFRIWGIRAMMILLAVLLLPIRTLAIGWTPTDAGLVVNLQTGDQFLLGVMVDDDNNPATPDVEYFVNNYNRFTGGIFNYSDGLFLKLLPLPSGADKLTEMNVWTVDSALTRVSGNTNYALGGVAYTIWNDGKTLKTTRDSRFKFFGDLTSDIRDMDACDVVFVVPTNRGVPDVVGRSPNPSSFDPSGTLGRGTAPFDGETGYNVQLGMVYREVYMFEIPRSNDPRTYTNAALVTFNTTRSNKSWAGNTVKPGIAAYAYADTKHDATKRTLFRLYMINKPFVECPNYFFATNEQNFRKYRKSNTMKNDSTTPRKTYSVDWKYPMYREGESTLHKTEWMSFPAGDSTYYYVGRNNTYVNGGGDVRLDTTDQAVSQFKNIDTLRVDALKDKKTAGGKIYPAPDGAYGRMVVDTTSTKQNLGVSFEPKEYMLRTSSGKNVQMIKTGDHEWTTQDMWTIDKTWVGLYIKATLTTGPVFSETDPGADIEGWSEMVLGSDIKDQNGEDVAGKSGYARIYTDRAAKNGDIVFITRNESRHLKYDNNDFLGVEIPVQYPTGSDTHVIVQANRLKAGYTFKGWTKHRIPEDGEKHYKAGDTIRLEAGENVLYAQASYDGTLHIALSFINENDHKRYFITHPNSSAPRFARARHFDHWENTWQGMENAENMDPNYISTFEMRYPINEMVDKIGDIPDLQPNERVLDPSRYTMKGYEDSLTFYEFFAPARDEYLGLYYTDPNTILANNTWAGLFTTTSEATSTGWPDYRTPYIPSAKLLSTRYVYEADPENHRDELTLKERGNNSDGTYVKYNAKDNQFDAVKTAGEATEFELTAISVADAHYIILPDTSEIWRDTIEFAYHQNEEKKETVWSKLIGKQLMAVMMVDRDTVYFHPNRNKVLNTPQELYLSQNFRLSENFEFIPDSRVNSVIQDNRASREETSDYWCNNIVSGQSSPINVKDKSGRYIDIVDTFRISLSQGGVSKIKKYYGRWADNAPGLKKAADGSRYRDVIVRTKTYHYGDSTSRMVLTPKEESYNFNPMAGDKQQLHFILTRETSQPLLDKDGNQVRIDVTKIDTLTDKLQLQTGYCTFSSTSGGTTSTYFTKVTVVADSVVLSTNAQNDNAGTNVDTLIISRIQVTGYGQYDVDVRVPLIQTSLIGDKLIWSVVHNGTRYYILPANTGLVFQQYTQRSSSIYKQNTNTALIEGSRDGKSDPDRYITPWSFAYPGGNMEQLTLAETVFGNNDYYFYINGDNKGALNNSSPTSLTYRYVRVNTNVNGNEEELVRLKYLDNKWLVFNGTEITAQELADSTEATVFSWTYLSREYNLQNKGTYPSRESLEFGYQAGDASVQTRYKAYKEYSMLVDNKITYLCREDEEDLADLINEDLDWKTDTAITLIRDERDFDGDDPVSSGLTRYATNNLLTTTIRPTGDSPEEIKIGGKFVDIVDTLQVTLSLQGGAPSYRFKGDWSKYTSIDQTQVKIPLIRKTYHQAEYDSVVCLVVADEYNYTFPATGAPTTHTFTLETWRRTGRHVKDVDNETKAILNAREADSTLAMHFDQKAYADIRLADEYGNAPGWCELVTPHGANTITVRCKENGIRSPRTAYIYMAYIIMVKDEKDGNKLKPRYINYRLTVSQPSKFDYANNQQLVHNTGASGDELVGGVQQVHENKRILYYYPDQDVELPVRERGFYGWWRWYREGKDQNDVDVGDTDIPDSCWRTVPRNVGQYNYPFRVIGDSVPDGKGGKKLATMGRYTVFQYPSIKYNNKLDPPAKNPMVAPPTTRYGEATKPILTYAVDISNYYDHLPMSVSQKNQVDTATLDTMQRIPEPTLSLREVFELHPWTEMAETLDDYKYPDATEDGNGTYKEPYMEDHVVMAPLGNRLLLRTEQRYNYANLAKYGHSESQMGYYMRDDNWATWSEDKARQDTMIWCGGWDADMIWYMYNPQTEEYTKCPYSITEENDFLNVPARTSLTPGYEFDTIYYCLRARSIATTGTKAKDYADDESEDGAYMFNICRYKVIYHRPDKYGPLAETKVGDADKALMTNEEIGQHYEVLERLNFDYNQPGSAYTVYPHPLPWADASYGYTYPETSALPHNRYHAESDFPNHGEYGIINRIPYSTYWHKMEQHGGAENGYMIYCDGMSSAGQVAALSLKTQLCEGQKMYFSAYVGNPSNQKPEKSCPNFTFSVQGSLDGTNWDDITSYMTGDIKPSDKWSQIYFPITYDKKTKDYEHFRVRIYNVASSFDGNDFIIDDMCLFATKPPLLAYDANTACMRHEENDSLTHVILRVDYQGFPEDTYNGANVYYTVVKGRMDGNNFVLTDYVPMEDGYFNPQKITSTDPAKPDTIYGYIPMPDKYYKPEAQDSIFENIRQLLDKFEDTDDPSKTLFRQGYIFENLDDSIRPVMYVIHKAKMVPNNLYRVHMSTEAKKLVHLDSKCAMTSNLKVNNRIMLELNGMEQEEKVITSGLCANTTYDISLRVKGTLFQDSVAPIDVNGSCVNDWLLYGDTADVTGAVGKKPVDRYGYTYEDIVKVVRDILRGESTRSVENTNQFAANLTSVNSKVMDDMKTDLGLTLTTSDKPYKVLSHLVNNGFLTLYKSRLTSNVAAGDSLQYVVIPILGTGSEALTSANVEVCPMPIFVKLKPNVTGVVPMMIGGLNRTKEEASEPVVILANETVGNSEVAIRIDSIVTDIENGVAIHSVVLHSTNDPSFREGVDVLNLEPDKEWEVGVTNPEDYYQKGDSVYMHPAKGNTFHMRPGYNYTFKIVMQSHTGSMHVDPEDPTSCEVGSVPFTVAIVPNQLRWNPQNPDNAAWNDPANWIGITQQNEPIHEDAHFAPLASTQVVIPAMTDGKPYPVVPNLDAKATYDSVKQVGFQYNTCDAIRFMPGAAIGQQQRMNYTTAVIDMNLPKEKWALRAAPVTGMLSGDVFMSNADLNWATSPWEVGAFDASGRNNNTGNASYWLSMYSTETIHMNYEKNDTLAATTDWVTVNSMTQSMPPAQGWAVYTRTKSGSDAAVRLPKDDDIYYYYYKSGTVNENAYENGLRTLRETNADAAIDGSHAGELAFHPAGDHQDYTLTNGASSSTFVFGNPTMGYIDIWGFIADNRGTGTANLEEAFGYLDESGLTSQYYTATKSSANDSKDTITNLQRYLPPMHAIVVTVGADSKTATVKLNTNRVVTWPTQRLGYGSALAPRRSAPGLRRGIMTVTAVNPVSPRCRSRLLLGQGYSKAIREGEDAILTTINIDNFSMLNTPTTPFNIYAMDGNYGLSIDLRDSLLNVPVSFYMSDLPYDPVTHLWFSGVQNIDGELVLYDDVTGSERTIIDGICLTIETPEQNHEKRYYIRRRGYTPSDNSNPIATDAAFTETDGEQAVKIIKNGHVLIIRNGHVYTMFGQKVR